MATPLRVVLAISLLVLTAHSHPGSGIAVDAQGNVFCIDTGSGVWKLDPQGKLTRIHERAYHWMAFDKNGSFAKSQSLGDIDGGSFELATPSGAVPALIISNDFPISVGTDGGLYYVPYKENGIRELVRKMPDGSRSMFAVLPAQTPAPDQLTPHRVKLEAVEYMGKRAVKIVEEGQVPDGEAYAVVKDAVFHDGEIEVELAGRPASSAGGGARGFIGIAFRLQGGQYEYIYLRPTNGRADDQVRRNHSTQYGSHPKFGFAEMRRQWPEKYESYVDLEPGVWTRYRITVEGTKARLYVHGAAQPCLIVNDLKLGDSSGGVALWIGPGTEGYFTGLKIQSAR